MTLVLDRCDAPTLAPVNGLVGNQALVGAGLSVGCGFEVLGAKVLVIAKHRLELLLGHVRKPVDGHVESFLAPSESRVMRLDEGQIVFEG